jgi:hypothetical protein
VQSETAKLAEDEIEKRTHQQDEINDSECGKESEEEQPERKKKGTFRKDKQDVAHQTANQSGPITTITLSFPCLAKSKVTKKHGRIKPHTKGKGSTLAVLCKVKTHVEFPELALCLHACLHHKMQASGVRQGHAQVSWTLQ